MKSPSRREFCAGCAAGALALGVAGCGGVQTLRPKPVKGGPVTLELSALKAAFVDQPAVLIDPGLQREMIIINGEFPGSLRAISAVCTHLGCVVRPMREAIVCPCHGATYTPEGKVTRGPAKRDLKSFPIKIEGDKVFIEV